MSLRRPATQRTRSKARVNFLRALSGSAGAGGRSGCPVVCLLGRVGVAQRARARGRVTGERVPPEEVDVVVLEWGQPGDQVVDDREAAGGQVLDGRVNFLGRYAFT